MSRFMITHALRGACVPMLALLLALTCTSCLSKPEFHYRLDNTYFAGCFAGPVTNFAGQPTLTVVVQVPQDYTTGRTLTGCFVIQNNPAANASFAGMVREDNNAIADIMTMPVAMGGLPPLNLQMERAPAGAMPAQSLGIVSTGGATFMAPTLQPCSATCTSLGVTVP